MKCHEFEATIMSMARGQLVEAAARDTAGAHLDRCARCADAFEEQQAITAGIRVAAESLANQEPSPRVEEALRRAFRERAGRLAERRITPQPAENGRWSRRVIGAAAAAILLLALLAGADWLKSLPASQKQEATNLPATPSISAPGRKQDSQALAGRGRDQNRKTASNSAGPRRLSKSQGVRQNVENVNEVATRFYPLVDEGEMAPLESGMIVRVEAPASILISLGLPVTAESINRPVQADLLLGQDGLARAIRFLP
ncbi:MAG TPA: hypothetical protein VJZ77_05820 [Blastocatellia bacterium]|nr:hypothetical protein [Blastocatellia bacterium]